MKLTDDEAILWGTMMFLAGSNAERGNTALSARQITAEEAREAKAVVAKEFETFKAKSKSLRRKVH